MKVEANACEGVGEVNRRNIISHAFRLNHE